MLNFKMDKVKSRLLLMRWAVLGCLMLAVGAVAIWGGSPRARLEQSAGIDNILTTRQTRLAQLETNPDQNRLTQQLQAHIGEDAQPVLPANADLQPSLPTTQTEKLTDNTQTPTVQRDKSHSREIGGTGLGLAITRSAILMHRGAIKVHSREGDGTIFTVRIPLNYMA